MYSFSHSINVVCMRGIRQLHAWHWVKFVGEHESTCRIRPLTSITQSKLSHTRCVVIWCFPIQQLQAEIDVRNETKEKVSYMDCICINILPTKFNTHLQQPIHQDDLMNIVLSYMCHATPFHNIASSGSPPRMMIICLAYWMRDITIGGKCFGSCCEGWWWCSWWRESCWCTKF